MQIPCLTLNCHSGWAQESAFEHAGGQLGGLMGKGVGPSAPISCFVAFLYLCHVLLEAIQSQADGLG